MCDAEMESRNEKMRFLEDVIGLVTQIEDSVSQFPLNAKISG